MATHVEYAGIQTKRRSAHKAAALSRPPRAPLARRLDISTIDVLDRVLDKGIVIDYRAPISVLGIDLLATIDARVVVASFETYLHHIEAGIGTLASPRMLGASKARPLY